jgi:hypothetical protein
MNSKKHHPRNKAERLYLESIKDKQIQKDATDELRPEGVDEKE